MTIWARSLVIKVGSAATDAYENPRIVLRATWR